jgi:hypothetical protein
VTSDDEVDNLICVSFVENASTDADEPLRARLRAFPNLARALSHYEWLSAGRVSGNGP